MKPVIIRYEFQLAANFLLWNAIFCAALFGILGGSAANTFATWRQRTPYDNQISVNAVGIFLPERRQFCAK
jgi:hypothetical protein